MSSPSTEEDFSEKNVKEDNPQDSGRVIPIFEKSEIILGKVLGLGGFCVIKEITGMKLENYDVDDEDATNPECNETPSLLESFLSCEPGAENTLRRKMMSGNLTRNDGDARYAIKQLRVTIEGDRRVHAIKDLKSEAKFLSMIDHPNVIKMRGSADYGPLRGNGFFIVLDRLYDTLEERLEKWQNRNEKIKYKSFFPKCRKINVAISNLWMEKIKAAHDLASALDYLHRKRIMHRDLKPDNIGFDVRNDLKLFDFGLACKIQPKAKSDEVFKLTGCTGSLRYMAPEVARDEKYGLSADVYSFGLLFWQILTTDVPFSDLTPHKHDELVVNGNLRPTPLSKWPGEWSALMEECWIGDSDERLAINSVLRILRQECHKLGVVKDVGGGLIRRKSSTSALAGLN